jgi:hypothetical protein
MKEIDTGMSEFRELVKIMSNEILDLNEPTRLKTSCNVRKRSKFLLLIFIALLY